MSNTFSFLSNRSTVLTVAAALSLTFILTGCSSEQPPKTSDQSSSETSESIYYAKLKKCLDDTGGKYTTDPKTGELVTVVSEDQQKCEEIIGKPPTSSVPEEDEMSLEQKIDHAKCLQEKGYKVQEPTREDPNVSYMSEIKQEDMKACTPKK